MSDKLLIHGVVLCPCGGLLVSNTGKMMYNHDDKKIHCWACNEGYDFDEVLQQRTEDETVIFRPEGSNGKSVG